jgi:heme A synthase
MGVVINQYSSVVVGIPTLLIAAFLCWRFLGLRYAISIASVVLLTFFAFQVVIGGGTSTYASSEDFESAVSSGDPVFLVLYSHL